MTINTVKLCSDHLVKYQLFYLLTDGLKQNCVENVFSVIRGKGRVVIILRLMLRSFVLCQLVVDALIFSSPKETEEDTGRVSLILKSTNWSIENVSPESVGDPASHCMSELLGQLRVCFSVISVLYRSPSLHKGKKC